jgi:CDP-paratose 2-epimerase
MATILITGGAGFVGSTLAIGLRTHLSGARIIAFDNLRRRGSEINLRRLQEAGVEFVHGDVRSVEDLDAVGAADVVLDCSAEPSVLAGYTTSPSYVVRTNLEGSFNCFEFARRWGADVMFLSTSRVYPVAALNELRFHEAASRFELDEDQVLPGASARGLSEEFPLEGARSLYGATKLCAELLLAEYRVMYGLRTVVNRCGVLAGPWQMGKVDQGVVALWVARHLFDGSLSYIGFGGEGRQVRDLLHVDDLLQLVVQQLADFDRLDGETFNVGGGRAVSASLQELTTVCQEVSGHAIPIDREPEDRPADVRVYISDCSRVTSATSWAPTRSVATIVDDTYRWMHDHRSEVQWLLGGGAVGATT